MSDYWGDLPVHPLNQDIHKFDIIRFDYHRDPEDGFNDFLEIEFKKCEIVRILRFIRPSNLKIEAGFPNSTRGMIILDISSKHWENIRVEVNDFEGNNGSVTFYAFDVIELKK